MFNARTTQLNLLLKGYDPGASDGLFGPKTFAALLMAAGMNHDPTKVPLAPAIGVSLARWLDPNGINTPLRMAHFLAQAACETAAFTKLKESDGGNPHYFDRYEGNKNLGNTHPGDGHLFCGRGLLDSTGRWNYQHLHDLTNLDCVNRPELLEVPENAVDAAVTYWNSRAVSAAADRNDLPHVTQLINGGQNGLADRQIFLDRLNKVISL